MSTTFAVCAHRDWNVQLFEERLADLPHQFHLLRSPADLTLERLKAINPEMIFFVDWSWRVPTEIVSQYKCVGFHTAPLPEFRGGSPIQNQIIRGIKQTKLTAFFMDEGLDTGDILLQEDVSLEGHLRDIFSRLSILCYDMIRRIVRGEYSVRKQEGPGSYYKRRTPEESELKGEDFERPLEFLYNFVRMLEDPYPNAFVRLGTKKLVFKEAEMDSATGRLRVTAEIVDMEAEENG